MPPGKLAAQAGHAFCDVLTLAATLDPDRLAAYHAVSNSARRPSVCRASAFAAQQRCGHPQSGTKIVLLAADAHALLQLYDEAIAARIPAILVCDQDHVLHPHFDGRVILTAVGLGPTTRDEHHKLTKRFRTA